jgi:radical SAM superfamily enzyme YgiQ (UPF0313 family)
VDVVCWGEGEITLLEILSCLKKSGKFSEIQGISFENGNGEIVVTNPRSLITDLDNLPFPEYKLRDYYDYTLTLAKRPFASVITSRGCYYKCAFCSSPAHWRGKVRQRSVENVISWLRNLTETQGVKFVQFVDDVFGQDSKWLNEFCRRMKQERFDLHWMADLHPLSLRKKKRHYLLKLREIGCVLLSYGAQSSDKDILARINRDSEEPEELKEHLSICNQIGIKTVLTYIFGLPGETKESISKSMKYIDENPSFLLDIHPLVVLPDSSLGKNKYISSELTAEEIDHYCYLALLKYYGNYKNLSRICLTILRENPSWLKIIPYLFIKSFNYKKTI